MLANKVLFDSDLKTLFGYIENKDELRKKVQSTGQNAPTN